VCLFGMWCRHMWSVWMCLCVKVGNVLNVYIWDVVMVDVMNVSMGYACVCGVCLLGMHG
jgi:hypothetical protein